MMLESEEREFNDSNVETICLSDSKNLQESFIVKSPSKEKNFNKKKYTYTCMYEDCTKSYSRSFHLRRHEAIHENSCHKCTEKGCERIFKTKSTLKKHVDNFHLKKNPKKYKCADCDEEFNKHNWLTRHQFKHTGVKPFVCSIEGCEKRFLYPSKLKRHMKVHEGYKCSKESCDQKFPTWTLYVRHVKTAHPTIHRCHICEKIFTRSTNFKDHLKCHELDRKVYLCPKGNCSKFYFTKRSLEYHLKSYHEKHPFECTLMNCNKAFKSQEDLNAHINHHDSKKRPRKKKKNKVKPTFAQKLAGLVPKKISSSSNTVDHKAEDMLSKEQVKITSSPEILMNTNKNVGNEQNSDFLSPADSDVKNEDDPCFTNTDSIESNLVFKETLLNSKLICPQNSMKCISA